MWPKPAIGIPIQSQYFNGGTNAWRCTDSICIRFIQVCRSQSRLIPLAVDVLRRFKLRAVCAEPSKGLNAHALHLCVNTIVGTSMITGGDLHSFSVCASLDRGDIWLYAHPMCLADHALHARIG